MTEFERGFAIGEADSFQDRKHGRPARVRPAALHGQYQEGYWSGYTPRHPAWRLRRTASQAWWTDREEQAA